MDRNYSFREMTYINLINYYKKNPHKYLEDVLGIKIKWYQKIYLKIMLGRK